MLISCRENDGHNPVSVNERIDPTPSINVDLPEKRSPDPDSVFMIALKENDIEVIFLNDTTRCKNTEELSEMIDFFDDNLIRDKITLEADSIVVMGRFQEIFRMVSGKKLGKCLLKIDSKN